MIEGIGQPTEAKANKSTITVDVIRECWDDTLGYCIKVRPDSDALGLVEIIECQDGKDGDVIAMDTEMAKVVAMAILDCVKELMSRESEA